MTAAWEAFLRSLDGGWGYVFLFLSSLAENLFPPLPGDTVLVAGAVLVGMGKMTFLPAYLSSTAGSFLGFMILYRLGRRWGPALVGRLPFFHEDHLERAGAWFGRYGVWVIGVNRFLSGFRGIVSLAAGMVKMNQRVVALLALASCLIWNVLLMVLGVWAGIHWELILSNYQRIVFILLMLAAVFLVIRMKVKKRKYRQEKE